MTPGVRGGGTGPETRTGDTQTLCLTRVFASVVQLAKAFVPLCDRYHGPSVWNCDHLISFQDFVCCLYTCVVHGGVHDWSDIPPDAAPAL
ncbi:hypothetical protein SPHINGO391_480055 [Sphingomonas aurantiaca]|uniref:Uncharacterized protein n=1 Tax=Sphingomonas aurantiaca TaxID=185949 RepID=A0A5E7ZZG5_9SPHN|nr:hypothetical protein SPHINGO391_480055 [Sphingomonas aurantiaca]